VGREGEKRPKGPPIEIKQVMLVDYDKNPFNDAKARIDRLSDLPPGLERR